MSKFYLHFIPFYTFLVNYLSAAVAVDVLSSFSPSQNILLSCGSSGTIITSDGRTWIGDVDSPHLPTDNSSVIAAANQRSFGFINKMYLTARLSGWQFTYKFSSLSAGPKFIRLYFYPTSYPNFDCSKAFFSVTTGSFTLLSNFSGSRRDNALGQDTVFKEFCINVQEGQSLNITFTPSPDHQDAYAFVNAIEIFSMPQDLYYTPHKPIEFVGRKDRYSIGNRNILETVYRLNVGGAFILPQDDTGMYRTWTGAYKDYLTDSKPGRVPVNLTIDLRFSMIPSYTAPVILYQTAMSMGSLAWEFPVDAGFTYVVRLHFCEFQGKIKEVGDRVFEIYIANILAETEADVIRWSGGNGIPIDRDYAVLIGQEGNENKKILSITLNPPPGYSDAILNGLEIFKVDNDGNLAGSNPDILITPLPNKKSSHAIVVSIISCVASSFVLLFLLNLFLFRRKRKAKASVSGTGISLGPFSSPMTKSSKASGSSQPSDHKLYGYFSLAEIKAANNNFDEILVIGVGGFDNVYNGWFINNEATPIAVKRLSPGSQQGAQEFKTEIEMLSQLRHRHLVSLIGYCNDDGEMILVYDYMARGTLRDHLYNSDNPPLPWNRRLQICIGAARGLHYLHTGAKRFVG